MNIVFLGDDLFNLYVALELLTFAAVPLVCLDGRRETLRSPRCAICSSRCADRCSICWARRCYTATYGTLDIVLLSARVRDRTCPWMRGALMTVGSARQDRAVSVASMAAAGPCRRSRARQRRAFGAGREGVVLPHRSALVRRDARLLTIDGGDIDSCHPRRGRDPRRQRPSRCGRQRLKLLIAYSTVAQIGYLFLDISARRLGAGEPWSAASPGPADAPALLARLRQGGHVHGGGAGRRSARP